MNANLPWSIRCNSEGRSCQLLDREGNTVAVFCDFVNAEFVLGQLAEVKRLEDMIEELGEEIGELRMDIQELENKTE